MKRIIFFTILAAAGAGVISCSGFLDEKPQDFLAIEKEDSPDEQVSDYQNLDGALSGLNGAYGGFQNDMFQMEIYMINDVMSDNCYLGGDGAPEEEMDFLKINSMNSKVEMHWEQYSGIAGAATNAIENMRLMDREALGFTAAQNAQLDRMIAEARVIRAWAYLDMVRLWGGIPMVLELLPPITAETMPRVIEILYPERSSAEEVYAQILSDLDETDVIPKLESRSSGYQRMTRGAAYGLLAKAYASMGGKDDRDYNKVVAYCDKVIAEGYTLVGDFDRLWTPGVRFTSESIFEYYYTLDQGNWAYWIFLSEYDDRIEPTWRRYATPTHEVVAKFESSGGAGRTDKRYAASIYWNQTPYSAFGWKSDNYPFVYKIRSKESDIILMRLADILLLKAEALVELNRVGEAIDIVNDIRDRAGLGRDLDRSMSQSEARLAVENERQLELFFEGQRWFDLIRNGRMIEVMNAHRDWNGDPYITGGVRERCVLYPFPQNELDLNEKLTQNPGY